MFMVSWGGQALALISHNSPYDPGLGYADVENRVPCTADTILRIASISKPITMAVVAKLWEAGQLDLDKSVNDYVESWPVKEFNKEKVRCLSYDKPQA